MKCILVNGGGNKKKHSLQTIIIPILLFNDKIVTNFNHKDQTL